MTLFSEVVRTSERVRETRSRREKTRHLAECLRRLAPDEVPPGVAFLSGELRQGRIGVGWAAVRDVGLGTATGTAPLTVRDVDRAFERIGAMQGRGSKSDRLGAVAELMTRAARDEQHFLQRLLIGEVRQGALEGVMLDAIAEAADLPAADVRRAAMLSGDVGTVARAALTEGSAGLAGFSLEVFRPIQPMLAQTADDVGSALDKLGRAGLEWKLDGARVQVHRTGDDVRVFTRKLNDVTAAVPEIVEATRRLPVRDVVLDGEAIALRADGTPHPFQVTMRRFGRRVDVERLRAEIPIVSLFFDCLHVDGDDLIDRDAVERTAVLAELLPETLVVPRLVTADAQEAEAFLEAALRRGHEGVLAKALDAFYEAGRRGSSWLKIKPAHTLDLVVLAAEWGSGRREGWLSNLHLGARDPQTGGFVMLGKTFKGLTDRLLVWQTERLQQLEVARDAHTVFVRPELVAEIAFDGVQRSRQYPGGVALRFARVKRYRSDKTTAEADTIDTVRAILQRS